MANTNCVCGNIGVLCVFSQRQTTNVNLCLNEKHSQAHQTGNHDRDTTILSYRWDALASVGVENLQGGILQWES